MQLEFFIRECTYRTSRSSGAGGQHVNKVETRVEVIWHMASSMAITEVEKVLLLSRLEASISAEGYLAASSQTARTQLGNKKLATDRLLRIVRKALVPERKRKVVPIPAGVKAARLRNKRAQSEKKAQRRGMGLDG